MRKSILATIAVGMFGAISTVDAQSVRRVHRGPGIVAARYERAPRPMYRQTTHIRVSRARGSRADVAVWELNEQKRDLRQIRDISRAWHHATARRSRYERSLVDQRLDAWLERELRETARRGSDPYVRHRLYELSRQLDALRWRAANGLHRRHDYRRKARILNELVRISETEVRRARERVPRDVRRSFALR